MAQTRGQTETAAEEEPAPMLQPDVMLILNDSLLNEGEILIPSIFNGPPRGSAAPRVTSAAEAALRAKLGRELTIAERRKLQRRYRRETKAASRLATRGHQEGGARMLTTGPSEGVHMLATARKPACKKCAVLQQQLVKIEVENIALRDLVRDLQQDDPERITKSERLGNVDIRSAATGNAACVGASSVLSPIFGFTPKSMKLRDRELPVVYTPGAVRSAHSSPVTTSDSSDSSDSVRTPGGATPSFKIASITAVKTVKAVRSAALMSPPSATCVTAAGIMASLAHAQGIFSPPTTAGSMFSVQATPAAAAAAAAAADTADTEAATLDTPDVSAARILARLPDVQEDFSPPATAGSMLSVQATPAAAAAAAAAATADTEAATLDTPDVSATGIPARLPDVQEDFSPPATAGSMSATHSKPAAASVTTPHTTAARVLQDVAPAQEDASPPDTTGRVFVERARSTATTVTATTTTITTADAIAIPSAAEVNKRQATGLGRRRSLGHLDVNVPLRQRSLAKRTEACDKIGITAPTRTRNSIAKPSGTSRIVAARSGERPIGRAGDGRAAAGSTTGAGGQGRTQSVPGVTRRTGRSVSSGAATGVAGRTRASTRQMGKPGIYAGGKEQGRPAVSVTARTYNEAHKNGCASVRAQNVETRKEVVAESSCRPSRMQSKAPAPAQGRGKSRRVEGSKDLNYTTASATPGNGDSVAARVRARRRASRPSDPVGDVSKRGSFFSF